MIGANPTNTTIKTEPETPCLSMRAREAAKAIGISERTLWQWTEDGYVPHIRRGKVVLYPVDALRDWLRRQAQVKGVDERIASGENKAERTSC